MRRWICCGDKKGDSDLSNEEVHLKSPWQNSEGMLQTQRSLNLLILIVYVWFGFDNLLGIWFWWYCLRTKYRLKLSEFL